MAGILFEIISRHASSSARSWWESALTTLAAHATEDDFKRMYTRAARMLGDVPIGLNDVERAALSQDKFPLVQGRALHELGRIALVLHAMEFLDPEVCPEFVDDLYIRGDLAERQALLRAFPLLPEPDRFLPTAVEACRSNMQTVFESIACENPYPVRHFPELNFNQMVMKAIFLGVPLHRIEGLSARITSVLVRMIKDYVQEQTAAGRSVPDDIYRITSRG